MSKFGIIFLKYKSSNNSTINNSSHLKLIHRVPCFYVHNMPKFQFPTLSSSKVIANSVHSWLISRPWLILLSKPLHCAIIMGIHNRTLIWHHIRPYDRSLYISQVKQVNIWQIISLQDPCTHFNSETLTKHTFGSFQDPCFSFIPAQWQVDSLYFNHPSLTGMLKTSNLLLMSGKVR